MTPLQIKMMLHYYACTNPYAEHEPFHAKAPAVVEQREWLVADGLLKVEPSIDATFVITERGRAYVDFLCGMPLPISKWIMPEGTRP